MPKSKTARPKSEDAKRVNTSLRLHRKTLKALKTRAIEDDTSVQKIIEELVDSYLKKAAGKKS
ncbi:hypothetical protein [Paracoccus haeundaensis]|jgi:hypothetical protein|uniref:Ribbon-helix-helix protein, CopG family n=1 Tax=Paracoccus haeundaensis TaxID=225362 RepID=A0A5C4R299_9RHOB|nr:hypothetical protein [Paracoccus haeundaensis]TNH38092.1 hypothetical protein FHD67_16755 [Paracoccus haeundaensis]